MPRKHNLCLVIVAALASACAHSPDRAPPRALTLAPASSGSSDSTLPSRDARPGSSQPPAQTATPAQRRPRHIPEQGCDLTLPFPEAFHADEAPLAPFARPADASERTTVLAEGHLRVELPAAWFPSRSDGEGYVLYQVNTGYAGDSFGIFVGDAPAFHAHRGTDFGLALGAVPMRGTLWTEGGQQRLEAIGLMPCASPRYLHVWLQSGETERFARMVAALRSTRLDPTDLPGVRDVALDPTRDATALIALTAGDPLARDLATRALASSGLHAPYPLDTVHPLADQVLLGRYATVISGAPTQVWVHIPVRAGHAEAPPSFRAVSDAGFAHRVTALAPAGCRAPALVLARDALTVRCENEPETRAVITDDRDPDAFTHALERVLHARDALARWQRTPALLGGYPASLCPPAPTRVSDDAGVVYASRDRCALALHPTRPALLAAAFEGSCADIPAARWAAPVRLVGRFDQVRGANGTYCRYTLGYNGRSAWLIAVGDEGTASAPITRAPTFAVDPRAVNTAVAFLHQLVHYATAERADAPDNVRPSVLASLGLDHAGSAGAVPLLRRLLARGGLAGAATAAVLHARATAPEHVEVAFLAVTVDLQRESAGWLITGLRPTELVPGARSPHEASTPPGSTGSTPSPPPTPPGSTAPPGGSSPGSTAR